MNINTKKFFKYSFYIGIVWLIILVPLIKFMPDKWAWENSYVENAQILILLTGFLISANNVKKSKKINTKKAWFSICAGLLLMTGRELNWGRVFFPKYIEPNGYAVFYDMKDIPGHEIINILIGICIFAAVLGIIFYVPWKKIMILLPRKLVGLFLIFFILTYLENRVGLSSEWEKIKMEELSEVGVYFLFDILILYYSLHFSKLKY